MGMWTRRRLLASAAAAAVAAQCVTLALVVVPGANFRRVPGGIWAS